MKKFFASLVAFAPMVTLAATGGGLGNAINGIINIINEYIIPLLFALAIVAFLWGVFWYLVAGGDVAKKKDGLTWMVYGLVGLAIMASVYALIGMLTGTLGEIGVEDSTVTLPSVPTR